MILLLHHVNRSISKFQYFVSQMDVHEYENSNHGQMDDQEYENSDHSFHSKYIYFWELLLLLWSNLDSIKCLNEGGTEKSILRRKGVTVKFVGFLN